MRARVAWRPRGSPSTAAAPSNHHFCHCCIVSVVPAVLHRLSPPARVVLSRTRDRSTSVACTRLWHEGANNNNNSTGSTGSLSASVPGSSDTVTRVAEGEAWEMVMAYKWDDIPVEEEMGPEGSRVSFTNKQGLDITGYLFPVDNAKAVVHLLHGHGCHLPFEFLASRGVGKHHVYSGSWVEHLNSRGFSVCGIDFQSHGRSQGLNGLRFYFNSFDDLVDDVIQFQREHVNTLDNFKQLPTFLCGISMGGCLATCVLNRVWDEDIYRGGVLLAPMLSLERISKQFVNRILRPFSFIMNIIAPTLAIVKVAENTMFPAIQEEFNVDPYTSGGTDTRVRVAVEYLNVTSRVMSSIQDSQFDFIAFHSEKDVFTDPEGSKTLYAKSGAKFKTLTLLDNMWHYLTHEDGNMNVLNSAISWMNERGADEPTRV